MAKPSILSRRLIFPTVHNLYKPIYHFIRKNVFLCPVVSRSATDDGEKTVAPCGAKDPKKLRLLWVVGLLWCLIGQGPHAARNISGYAFAGDTGLAEIEKLRQSESPSLVPAQEMEIFDENRFIDNGNGTVTDRKTHLMWIKTGKPMLGAITWKEADSFCEALNFAGYFDWRLPTKAEWSGLIDTRHENPALPVFNLFTNVVTYLDYWTKTDHPIGPGYAWAVNLYYGKYMFLGKKKHAFVWPVRYTTEGLLARESDLQTASGKTAPEKTGGDTSWQRMETKYTVIYYTTLADLNTFAHHINYPAKKSGLKRPFHSKDAAVLTGRIETKVDALFERVQDILDMRKKSDRLAIYIFPDRESLNHAVRRISKNDRQLKSWYFHQSHSIYTYANALHEKTLARDMAFAIIYNHLNLPPSRAAAQILARHVDQNLLK